MNQKKKIENYIKKHFPITNEDIQTIEIIERITNILKNKKLINFSFNKYIFAIENETWLQCEYTSKIGKTIIFDHIIIRKNWKTINNFIEDLIKYDKEIIELENKIIFKVIN